MVSFHYDLEAMDVQPLVVIVGPTAVGKSAIGIKLAQAIDGEIISGDSVQIYRKLDIGSAKPSIEERENIPHHLLDCLDPAEHFTVAQFQALANDEIVRIRERGRIPIILGGTGLYIRSILDPYSFSECSSSEIRQKWTNFLDKQGKEALHTELEKCDPESAHRLHENDVVRVIRALEIFDLTGIPFSGQMKLSHDQYLPLDPSIMYIGLTAPREILYERINSRCLEMLQNGLLEETLSLLKEGYAPDLKPLQSIGYKHAIWQLMGLVTPWEMLRLLQRDTRHFAKRQLTWFRRDHRITWYDIAQLTLNEILSRIIETCSAIKTRVE